MGQETNDSDVAIVEGDRIELEIALLGIELELALLGDEVEAA